MTPLHFIQLIEGAEVVLGMIWDDSEIRTVKVRDGSTHSTQGLYGGIAWRYVPDANRLFWWERPPEDLKEFVVDWVEQRYGKRPTHGALYDQFGSPDEATAHPNGCLET